MQRKLYYTYMILLLYAILKDIDGWLHRRTIREKRTTYHTVLNWCDSSVSIWLSTLIAAMTRNIHRFEHKHTASFTQNEKWQPLYASAYEQHIRGSLVTLHMSKAKDFRVDFKPTCDTVCTTRNYIVLLRVIYIALQHLWLHLIYKTRKWVSHVKLKFI